MNWQKGAKWKGFYGPGKLALAPVKTNAINICRLLRLTDGPSTRLPCLIAQHALSTAFSAAQRESSSFALRSTSDLAVLSGNQNRFRAEAQGGCDAEQSEVGLLHFERRSPWE